MARIFEKEGETKKGRKVRVTIGQFSSEGGVKGRGVQYNYEVFAEVLGPHNETLIADGYAYITNKRKAIKEANQLFKKLVKHW